MVLPAVGKYFTLQPHKSSQLVENYVCTVIVNSIPKYNTRKCLRNVWSLVASHCGRQARARQSNAVVRIIEMTACFL